MKVDFIPYQIIALSAPSEAAPPNYQKFVAPYEWKPRDQNTFQVKNYQAAILKINYNVGSYDNEVDLMQFKLIAEGSSDGMFYKTINEWTLDVPSIPSQFNEHIFEFPLLGITHLRPILQSINFRGRVAIVVQMYLR